VRPPGSEHRRRRISLSEYGARLLHRSSLLRRPVIVTQALCLELSLVYSFFRKVTINPAVMAERHRCYIPDISAASTNLVTFCENSQVSISHYQSRLKSHCSTQILSFLYILLVLVPGTAFHGTGHGPDTIRYDTIGEFNVDSKAEYSALSGTRSQKKKLKQTTPVPL